MHFTERLEGVFSPGIEKPRDTGMNFQRGSVYSVSVDDPLTLNLSVYICKTKWLDIRTSEAQFNHNL